MFKLKRKLLNLSKRLTTYTTGKKGEERLNSGFKSVTDELVQEIESLEQLIKQQEYCLYELFDKKLIEECKGNYFEVFKKVKTQYGKVGLLDKIWSNIKIDGYRIDYSSLIDFKEELYKIFEHCLKSGNETLITQVTCLFHAMFVIKGRENEVAEVKEIFLNLVKKYGDVAMLCEYQYMFERKKA